MVLAKITTFLLLLSLSSCLASITYSDLRHDILKRYDKQVNPDHKVTVSVGISLLDLDICGHKQKVTFDSWANLQWNDERLSWDPARWNNITRIRLEIADIWLPDISAYNSHAQVKTGIADGKDLTNAIIFNDGRIIYVPPVHYKFHCNLNYDHWPWGEQNCTLQFGSWTYDMSILDVVVTNTSFGHMKPVNTMFFHNNQFEVISSYYSREERKYPCCPDEVYPLLNFGVVFKRIAAFNRDKLVTAGESLAGHHHAGDDSKEDD